MPEISPEKVQSRGVGAVLEVNGRTRTMTSFLDKFPSHLGNTFNPGALHVTMVDWAETVIDVFTQRDLIALHNVEAAMSRYLGALPLEQLTVEPEVRPPNKSCIDKFGRRIGITLVKTALLEDIRGSLGELLTQHLDVKLADKGFDPHVSVAHPARNVRRGRVTTATVKTPAAIPVVGYSIGQKTFSHQSSRLRNKSTKYTNRPHGFRSV